MESSCLICGSQFPRYDSDDDDDSNTSDSDGRDQLKEDSEQSSIRTGEESGLEAFEDKNIKHELANDDLKGLICKGCSSSVHGSVHLLHRELATLESHVKKIHDVCRMCSDLAFGEEVKCDSRDCQVFYARVKETNNMKSLQTKVRLIMRRLGRRNGDWLSF